MSPPLSSAVKLSVRIKIEVGIDEYGVVDADAGEKEETTFHADKVNKVEITIKTIWRCGNGTTL